MCENKQSNENHNIILLSMSKQLSAKKKKKSKKLKIWFGQPCKHDCVRDKTESGRECGIGKEKGKSNLKNERKHSPFLLYIGDMGYYKVYLWKNGQKTEVPTVISGDNSGNDNNNNNSNEKFNCILSLDYMLLDLNKKKNRVSLIPIPGVESNLITLLIELDINYSSSSQRLALLSYQGQLAGFFFTCSAPNSILYSGQKRVFNIFFCPPN